GWTLPDSAPAEWLSWLSGRLSAGSTDGGATDATIARRFEVFRAHRRMFAGYRPRTTVRASTVLIGAQRSANLLAQPPRAGFLAGTVSATNVDGDHYTFLQPPRVRQLAALIRQVPALTP